MIQQNYRKLPITFSLLIFVRVSSRDVGCWIFDDCKIALCLVIIFSLTWYLLWNKYLCSEMRIRKACYVIEKNWQEICCSLFSKCQDLQYLLVSLYTSALPQSTTYFNPTTKLKLARDGNRTRDVTLLFPDRESFRGGLKASQSRQTRSAPVDREPERTICTERNAVYVNCTLIIAIYY